MKHITNSYFPIEQKGIFGVIIVLNGNNSIGRTTPKFDEQNVKVPNLYRLSKKKMKLFIKYMVSIRCKMLVKEELDKLGLHYTKVHLGEVNVMEHLTIEQYDQLKRALMKSGLQLMDNKKAILIEKIKDSVIEMTHCTNEPYPGNVSDFISKKLNHDYAYLANLFSEVMGITIEHYMIAHKIERVKELILYNELNLTEISYRLNYSSVAHLSSQFKKVTGLTPTFFKQLKHKKNSTTGNV